MNIKKVANLLGNFIIRRLAEIFGLLILFSGSLLFLALATYSPDDPNFIFPKNTEIKKKEILNFIYSENGVLSLQNFVSQLNKEGYLGGEYLGTFMVSNIYLKLITKIDIAKIRIKFRN